MTNTQLLPNLRISQPIQNQINHFIQWHNDLKASLDKLSLSGNEKLAYLNKVLPVHKARYYEQIEQLGNLCFTLDKNQRKLIFNHIAQSGLHEKLKGAPFFYHSIFKPRGYAGDAETMALMYRNQFEGSCTFTKLLNKIGTESDAGIAIRNRKNLLHNAFQQLRDGKVLSLAAGPAQEIYQYLNTQNSIDFLALDHDIKTLENANRNIAGLQYGVANAFHLIKGNNKYLLPKEKHIEQCDPKKDTKGIRKILLPFKYKIKALLPASYDLVYSIGLYDYIQTFDNKTKGTTALTKVLFDLLKPNGRLLIGNISPRLSTGTTWAMECLCDWHLIHRTKVEVLAFADAIPKNKIKSIKVVTEETGINWFLDIRKT